ncbi:heparan-alpha-glucosaminide N-acetyltransferase domain-containing protein [Luteimonas sp. gir]|uniref:acyltransferase family protein n=1 Tax=Luteimonas sp. gir TaxID=3127960 RepID=UPI003075D7FB
MARPADRAAPSARLASVDALRGIAVAAMLLVNTPGDWDHVYAPLLHAAWHGCTLADLVFPTFLFVVGVSIALALSPRREAGADLARLRRSVLVRAARLVLIGLALHLLAWWVFDLAHFRPWGVLQRIGVCFALAGLAALSLSPRGQWALLAGLLVASAVALGLGGTAPGTNPFDRLDNALFAPWLYRYDPVTGLGHDPEGLASTAGALATTLLGVRAGDWLRAGRVRALLALGVAACMLGAAWSLVLPFNKPLWSASYVLWTGGLAALALVGLHLLIDRRGWPAWGRRFGVNAIAVYAGSSALVLLAIAAGLWAPLYRVLFAAPLAPLLGEQAASLAFALAFVALWWAIAAWMDRRRWYLKV